MAGHITKRKYSYGTRWRARHPDPSKGGSAKIERTFRTRREAELWLDELKHSARSGQFIDPRSKQTFAHVVEEWRATWGSLGPKTKAGYDGILETHILPRWGKAKVSGITADRIQEWVNKDLAPTRAAGTVANIFNVLRNVLTLAVRRRYIASNPCSAIKLPSRRRHTGGKPRRKSDHIYLSPAEIGKLAQAIDPHYRVPVELDGHTGLRAGELWALRRRDVSGVDGKLSVELSLKQIDSKSEYLTDDEKGMVFSEPKSEAAQRTFTLPAHTLKLLRAYLAEPGVRGEQGYAVLREHAGRWRLDWSEDANDPDRLVFTTPSGLPVRHNLFYRRTFVPAVKKALPQHADYANRRGLTFHDLRHTAASHMLAVSKGNFYLVKERLGHEDIQTTVNTYGHLVPHADQAIAASLSALFEQAEAEAQRDNVRELVRSK